MARTPSTAKAPFRQKEPDRRTLTSERIADDIESFESSGGHIEVLGVTWLLKKLDPLQQPDGARPAQPRSGTRRS
jgi:hypothetical protein